MGDGVEGGSMRGGVLEGRRLQSMQSREVQVRVRTAVSCAGTARGGEGYSDRGGGIGGS